MRRSRRLTRDALARRAGISERAARYWEAGERLPRIPELEAALEALNASAEERVYALHLVGLPRAHQAARILLAQSMPSAGATWAGVGDLLRAMRMRGGLTQAQTAARLQVSRQALVKWEVGENAPTPENLARLCALLNAHAQERLALQSGRLPPPLFGADASGGGKPALLACEEAGARFRRAARSFKSPLIDLQALSLKQHLRLQCERSPGALLLLAEAEYEHSLWLYYQERRAEAHACLTRLLQMMKDGALPLRVWDKALNLAGWYATQRTKDCLSNARLLRHWQPYLPEGCLMLTRCCDTALYAAQSYERETALRYLRQAETCLPTSGRERVEGEQYLEITRARVRLSLDADPAALDWLLKYASVTCNAGTHLLNWIKVMQDRGDQSATLAALRLLEKQTPQNMPPKLQRIQTWLAEQSASPA